MMCGTIVPELRVEAERLTNDLARLEQLQAGIKAKRDELRADIARLEASRDDLTGLIQRKKDLVASGSAELEVERSRAAGLASKAQNLKQLMASLAAAKADAEAAKQAAAAETLKR